MKEWMNMGIKPVYTSGFEREEFDAYAQASFQEILDTSPITDTVTLFNYDLSQSKDVVCVVQNNTSENMIKSLERTILFPIGTVHAGMYIKYNGNYWLLTGYVDNNKIYEKITATLCTYLLRWQNARGEIIERWVSGTSAAKYDIGERTAPTITFATNTFSLLMPNDDECMNLDQKRVFIDRKKENPTKVYKITRSDDFPYDYGEHGGILSFIVNKSEFNKDTDNQDLRICNYFSPDEQEEPPAGDNETPLSSSITGNKNLKIGYPRTYTADFYDINGDKVENINFTWNVICNFSDKIQINEFNNVIKLQVDEEELAGSSILLQVIVNEAVLSDLNISVTKIF